MEERPIVTAQASRSFRHPAEKVFDAWINPERIRHWFAPGLGEVTHVEVNPGVGGHFAITQEREDGPIIHIGEYLQLIHPRRLIFTWTVAGDEGADRVVVDIAPKPAGCDVTLHYEMDEEWVEFLEDSELAWAIMLDTMAQDLDEESADS